MASGIWHLASGMKFLKHLFDNNRAWAAEVTSREPEFFSRLAAQQSPEYLWIGCSDSRVPANEIVGLLPGELFVHRNIANLVVHTDLNCLSVLQFAIDDLRIKHVIVCGHYRCGGVAAALAGSRLGLVDNWLRHVQDVQREHRGLLDAIDPQHRAARLAELNVVEQVRHVCETTIAQDAWARGQALTVHGWIYDVADGLLRDLNMSVNGASEVGEAHAQAVRALTERSGGAR